MLIAFILLVSSSNFSPNFVASLVATKLCVASLSTIAFTQTPFTSAYTCIKDFLGASLWIMFKSCRGLTLEGATKSNSPLLSVVTRAESFSLLEQSLAWWGSLKIKHPVVLIVCYTNLMVFSTSFDTIEAFFFNFFHPDFLKVFPLALYFLAPFYLDFSLVKMVLTIL